MHRSLSILAAACFTSLVALAACGTDSDSGAAAAAAGSTSAGSGGSTAGSGTAGTTAAGAAGSGTAGTGTAGSGTAGSGTAGSGTAGAPMCDVGTVPTTPNIDGKFVQDGDQKLPATVGGDPTGAWQLTKLTAFLPGQAKGVVDEKMSTMMGTGFVEFSAAGEMRLATKFHTMLVTTLFGTVEQDTDTKTKGTFTVKGDTLEVKPECTTGGEPAAPPAFSREGDKITLILSINVMGGVTKLVFEGSPLP